MASFSFGSLLTLSAIFRSVLIIYGEWQDAHMEILTVARIFAHTELYLPSLLGKISIFSVRFARRLLYTYYFEETWCSREFVHWFCYDPFVSDVRCQLLQAAFWYGLVVHFRIYPIIYALPILLILNPNLFKSDQSPALQKWSQRDEEAPQSKLGLRLAHSFSPWFLIRTMMTKERILFGLISSSIFTFCTGLLYYLYGWEFLHEALLYHLTHLAFCWFAQTVAFVAFNKVITAQYFVWFFCLLPLILPWSKMKFKWKGLLSISIWTGAQLHWLIWGYLLEFKGKNVLIQLWMASILFLAANTAVLSLIINQHKLSALFTLPENTADNTKKSN
ncbi:GPI mannosyltransferase 1, partial [Cucurbita argyrosperma subsp. sororia]